MKPVDADRHELVAYRRALRPLKRKGKLANAVIVGWDTEFTTHGPAAELMAQSFWGGRAQQFIALDEERGPPLLEWPGLYELACECAGLTPGGHDEQLVLAVFYSQAEVQHMDVDTWEVTPWSLKPGAGHYDYADEQGRKLTIFDVSLFFPGQSLARVAEAFGLRKHPYNVAYLNQRVLADPAFREYALNDAYLHREVLTRLRAQAFEEWQVDVLDAATPATLSARVYRRHWLKEVLGPPPPAMRRLTLRATLGGTVQAFNRGVYRGSHFELDSDSNYAQCAVHLGVLPRTQDMFYIGSIDEVLDARVRGGVVQASFEFHWSFDRPCLPVQSPDSGRVYYPTRGVTFASIEEVRLAVELGAVVKVQAGWGYSTGDSSLPDYLRYLIDRKVAAERAGDLPGRALAKITANALVGKFAQRSYSLDPVLVRAFGVMMKLTPSETYRMEFLEQDLKEWLRRRARDEGLRVEVGSYSHGTCYRPEWFALITGLSRAAACAAFQDSRVRAGNVDSLILAAEQAAPVVTRGVTFAPREQGDTVVIHRERLWALYNRSELLAAAQHAVHAPNAWEQIIPSQPDILDFTYEGRRMATYRERLAENLPVGGQRVWQGQGSTRWGWKRILIDSHGVLVTPRTGYGDGPWETAPWMTVEEAERFHLEAA
jgi:hypothetical protein